MKSLVTSWQWRHKRIIDRNATPEEIANMAMGAGRLTGAIRQLAD